MVKPFQIPTPDSLITIVSKPEQIHQIATAPNEVLSLHAAAKSVSMRAKRTGDVTYPR